jgi:hypothetical protein
MGFIQRWRPEPLHPTREQEKTALQLSDGLIGARGRSGLDGNVELRTVQENEIRRYIIYPDGTRFLVEARPVSARYRRLERARIPAGLLLFPLFGWVILAQAIDFHDRTAGWAVGVIFLCMTILFVSEIVLNREIERPGEQWQRVGGSD